MPQEAEYLTPKEAFDEFKLKDYCLRQWRKRGCVALPDGQTLQSIPDPIYPNRFRYHRGDLEKIADVQPLRNGACLDTRGRWLTCARAKSDYETNSNSLIAFRDRCPSDVQKVPVNDSRPGLRETWVYYQPALRAYYKGRASWPTVRKASKQLHVTEALLYHWLNNDHPILGKRLHCEKVMRKVGKKRRPVAVLDPKDVKALKRIRFSKDMIPLDEAATLSRIPYATLYSFRLNRTSPSRKALGIRVGDFRRLPTRTDGQRDMKTWHIRESALDKIISFRASSPDLYLDEEGQLWRTGPNAESEYGGVTYESLRKDRIVLDGKPVTSMRAWMPSEHPYSHRKFGAKNGNRIRAIAKRVWLDKELQDAADPKVTTAGNGHQAPTANTPAETKSPAAETATATPESKPTANTPDDTKPKREKYGWVVEATKLVDKHPEWSDRKIARSVGKSPSQLSRSRVYQIAAQQARGDKAAFQRGRRTADGGIEAYDNP